jgi:N-acyl-D-amino-acid deacylase
MFASDAGVVMPGPTMPHPKAFGTNARVLAKYVREEKIITLEEAIRRMTSLPARKFQLRDRGILQEGMAADIVVFDEKNVKDISTFTTPHAYSVGFSTVIVNGKVVVSEGKHTGLRPGHVLKGPAYKQHPPTAVGN